MRRHFEAAFVSTTFNQQHTHRSHTTTKVAVISPQENGLFICIFARISDQIIFLMSVKKKSVIHEFK